MRALLDAYRICDGYKICEDALVYFWNDRNAWGVYAGSASTPFTNIVTQWDGLIGSLCPTSGRCLYCYDDGDSSLNIKMVVVDLF